MNKAWTLLVIAIIVILVIAWVFLVYKPISENNGVWSHSQIIWAIVLGIVSALFWINCGAIGAEIQNDGCPRGYNDWDMSVVEYLFGPFALIFTILCSP